MAAVQQVSTNRPIVGGCWMAASADHDSRIHFGKTWRPHQVWGRSWGWMQMGTAQPIGKTANLSQVELIGLMENFQWFRVLLFV